VLGPLRRSTSLWTRIEVVWSAEQTFLTVRQVGGWGAVQGLWSGL